MMNFIKTVRTTNGNYAVFFVEKNTGNQYGVFLNKDGHLVRPMTGYEAGECWIKWAAAAEAVVTKFHIPFLTIGRELEKWSAVENGDRFSSREAAQKWVEEDPELEMVEIHQREEIAFMGKTIKSVGIWWFENGDESPNWTKVNGVDCPVSGSYYFYVVE